MYRFKRCSLSDFDECVNFNTKFNDCSEDAHCFNLRGTYTCSCKEGFADLSGNPIYPGRICSAELIGCEKCNYHGTCFSRGDDQMLCECFQWYAGNNCHVNLKGKIFRCKQEWLQSIDFKLWATTIQDNNKMPVLSKTNAFHLSDADCPHHRWIDFVHVAAHLFDNDVLQA